MERSARAKTPAYVKYLIPVVIVIIVLVIFLSLRSKREKEAERVVTEEAVKHIESLKEEAKEPIDIEKADHFVDAQTVLLRKDRQIVITTPKELLEDESLSPESPIKILVEKEKTTITTPRELLKSRTIGPKTPIRVLQEEEKVIVTTPRELLENQSITLDTPIRVLMDEGMIVVTTPRELLEDGSITLDTPIRIVVKEKKIVVTTPEELLEDQSITLDTPIKIVLIEEKMITTTLGELLADKSITLETPIKLVMEEPEEMVTVSKLLKGIEGLEPSGKTFYIHAVTSEDTQGIWGILQHGLMDQFRKGIPLPEDVGSKGESVLTLDLPRDADEPLENGRSSFLGMILDKKTRDSYVYNYTNGRMGRNPDYIAPGQELVVTEFSQEELVEIYRHFAQKQ